MSAGFVGQQRYDQGVYIYTVVALSKWWWRHSDGIVQMVLLVCILARSDFCYLFPGSHTDSLLRTVGTRSWEGIFHMIPPYFPGQIWFPFLYYFNSLHYKCLEYRSPLCNQWSQAKHYSFWVQKKLNISHHRWPLSLKNRLFIAMMIKWPLFSDVWIHFL